MKLETFSVFKPHLKLLNDHLFVPSIGLHCSIHQHNGYSTTSSAIISAWLGSRWITVAIAPETHLYSGEMEGAIRDKLDKLMPEFFPSTQMMVQISMVNSAGEHHEVPNHMVHSTENM